MFLLHNKTIAAISLSTPHGCMGECPWFRMKVLRTGAIDYHGMANVETIGERRGSVNYLEFDSIASVVETSGFLDLSEEDDGDCVSTIGNAEIGVEFVDGRSCLFVRDAMNQQPIFWAVSKLMTNLLEGVKWGDDEYDGAEAIYAAHEP